MWYSGIVAKEGMNGTHSEKLPMAIGAWNDAP